ncbi:uncharacterized protein LOC118425338 [Branchiostoma floridae]|uniref:Uncharacterized protein LOC118425338 n=1 Tax=Branchiostoma floridae TaxID=7739 RepID=A0A9J7LYX6_BRAFL|nr:uncharacterized protein LOC118425338 [Branchiostoma floridae]
MVGPSGWLETDPTWVTSDEWYDHHGVRHVSGYVLDLNFNTGWKRAPEEGTWQLTFDLQTPKTVSRIRLFLGHEIGPDVTVLRSTSAGQRWNVVKEFTEVISDEAKMFDLTGFLSTGQHWRLEFTSLTSQSKIYEVMFFQACSGLDRTVVCSDGDCDVYDVICDGKVDCDDGSDEANCDEEVCPNGIIITKTQVCDGRDDCGDNTDEEHCCERQDKKSCRNGDCITMGFECDGKEDCADGSDEISCSVSTCTNGALFNPATRCDGRDDCGDNSDEENCTCYYLQDKGASYRGRLNYVSVAQEKTSACQYWASQQPHAHNHTPENFRSAGLEMNYCRNPDRKDRPWCYTNNPLIRWMYCDDVFACDALPTRCYYERDKGMSYAGHVNSHPHTPQAHPDAGLEENFCRNPDNKERPWCYTTDAVWRWDYCDVVACADPSESVYEDDQCTVGRSCKGRSISCYCDEDCSFFGDCCEDFKEEGSSLLTIQRREKWKCLSGYYPKASYWLVADCPDDWADDVTREACLKEVDTYNYRDLIHRMPVQDGSTNIPYRNIFCARCNNASMSEVFVWQYSVTCSGLMNSSTQFDLKSTHLYSDIVDDISLLDCTGSTLMQFVTEPNPPKLARSCISHDVEMSEGHCDAIQCTSYTSPLRDLHATKTYKNIHCALCEGLSLEATKNLVCDTALQSNVCFPRCMSLTHLFNFNDDQDDETRTDQCPSDTLYDPFVDTCRLYSSTHVDDVSSNKSIPFQNCSNHTANFTAEEFNILPNGTINRMNSSVSCPVKQTIKNCSKPSLTFTEEEFNTLPNGSVHLVSSNVTCSAEQVTILNTSALVCGECILEYFLNFTNGDRTTNSWEDDQGWLTLGLVIVSVVAVLGFVGYTVGSGNWKKAPEKLKVQMLTCMAVAESLFVARLLPRPGVGCVVYGIILHYFLLTAFTSMNALSLDLFLTFRQASERAKLRTYMLYTWLIPLLVVAVTAFVEFCPCSSVRVGYGDHCWIGNPTGRLVAFGVPVFCTLLINAVLITQTLLAIRKAFNIADAALSRSWSSKAWVYVRISFLMGFTWILGFIVPYVDSRVLEYIFIVLNGSQGFLQALLLTMTSKVMQKCWSAIRARFGSGEPNQNNGRSAATGSPVQLTSQQPEVV